MPISKKRQPRRRRLPDQAWVLSARALGRDRRMAAGAMAVVGMVPVVGWVGFCPPLRRHKPS